MYLLPRYIHISRGCQDIKAITSSGIKSSDPSPPTLRSLRRMEFLLWGGSQPLYGTVGANFARVALAFYASFTPIVVALQACAGYSPKLPDVTLDIPNKESQF